MTSAAGCSRRLELLGSYRHAERRDEERGPRGGGGREERSPTTTRGGSWAGESRVQRVQMHAAQPAAHARGRAKGRGAARRGGGGGGCKLGGWQVGQGPAYLDVQVGEA